MSEVQRTPIADADKLNALLSVYGVSQTSESFKTILSLYQEYQCVEIWKMNCQSEIGQQVLDGRVIKAFNGNQIIFEDHTEGRYHYLGTERYNHKLVAILFA